ncbi:MAG TPA: sulfotransferase [Candidatus Binatia bacterium]|nr:sulfotransferase [Candidatus Binatia bacterium]
MIGGPVFVAGLERSGTSLMYALLASHPNIAMTRRTNMWTYFYGQYGDLQTVENFERCLSMMMRYKRLVKLEPDPQRIRREFLQGERTYSRLFALLEEHYAERLGKPRWGDKSLHTERYAEPIFAAYPGARMLHMIRDPRDRYASVLARWKSRRGRVGAGTAMWLSSVALAQENARRYPQQVMVVRYETLAAEPEATLEQICAFIGEAYAPEMLTMKGARKFRDDGSNSSYGERKPGVISTSSVGRFRQVLSPQQIAYIQSRSAVEMARYDYALEPITLTRAQRLLFTLYDWPLNQALFVAWHLRHALQNAMGRRLPDYRIVPEVGTT